MTIYLRQSTASQEVPLGYFLDSADGDTEETALTIANTDIKIWKTGATTLANKNSGGATHISNGIYYAVLDATDTNTVGPLVIFVHVAGALAVRLECDVLPANVYDARYGSDLLDVNASQWAGVVTAADDIAIKATLAKTTDITGFNDPSSAAVADAVWDEAIAAHLTAGSTGEALNSAGASGDPWATAVPGAYAAGTAGNILGNNLDAAVSSRLAASSYTAPDNTTIANIEADTQNIQTRLPAALVGGRMDADVTNATSTNAIADALLKRDWNSVTGEAARSVLNALRALRNRVAVAGTTMTVYEENDTTAAWTATVTEDATANPVTEVDPV